jgi:Ankyrin repeats (3 copies)
VALARILVERAPEVVRFRAGNGRLPIHHAAAVGPLALVEFLLERCPESIDLVTDDGCTPLHAAATRQDPSREAVVESLVAKSPASLQVPNALGFCPVEVAASCDAPLDMLFMLVTKWPDCVRRRRAFTAGEGDGTVQVADSPRRSRRRRLV